MGGEREVMRLAKLVFDISSVALIVAILLITPNASLKFEIDVLLAKNISH